jgi:endogenous inhibitor of DNA gyrase (YacG/DUF329 family)
MGLTPVTCKVCVGVATADLKNLKRSKSDTDKTVPFFYGAVMDKDKTRTFVCRECGKTVTAEYGNKIRSYCSDRCKRRAEHRQDHKHRKAQMREGFVEQVVFKKLYKRDGGICQICGKPVKYQRCETDV